MIKFNINVSVLLVVCVVTSIFVLRPFSCPQKPSLPDYSLAHTELENIGYKPATNVPDPKPDDLPPAVKEGSTSTVSGQGYWTPETNYQLGDTLDVELSVVELADGTAWVKVTIDSVEVKWQRLEHYRAPLPERKWTLFAEAVNSESRVGVGIGYRIFTVAEVNVSPALSISPRLDWIAGEVRVTKNIFSGVAIGGGVGWRLSTDVLTTGDRLSTNGLHLSAGISIEL